MSAEQPALHQLTTAELLRVVQQADEEALQAAHAAAEQCLEHTHGDIHRALVRAAEAS